jgi:hypothetical protein
MARARRKQQETIEQAVVVSPSAACFITATACLAVVALLASWSGRHATDVPALGVAAVAALLCGSRTIRISDLATVSVGFVVVFLTLLHVGIPEACVVAALSGLAGGLLSPERHPRSPLVPVFAFASIVVTAWVAGQVFVWAGGRPGATEWHALGAPAALAAVTYHTVNCALVAGAAGLTSERALDRVFREHVNSSALAYYGGAGWAVLVHLAWQLSGPWTLIAAVPPLYSLHVALFRRTRQCGHGQ